MARFRIRTDARRWFGDLRSREKTFKTDFDSFYFCFMAGISAGAKKPFEVEDTAELVDHYPDVYGGRGHLLVSLLLLQELKEMGVLLEEKKAVHLEIAKLISTGAPNFLSDEGVRLFNSYAYAGFDVLQEWFDDRPQSLTVFLQVFKRKFDEALAITASAA